MARISEQASVLVARDVSAAIDYWVEKLGFAVRGRWGEPVGFAILERDGARVMLGQAKPEAEITPYWKQRDGLWNAYFWVDDARTRYHEMTARGAVIDYDLCTQPYGVLEFGVRDLEGHDIAFGQVVEA